VREDTILPMIQAEQDHGSGITGRPISVRDESSEDISVEMEDASIHNNLDITQQFIDDRSISPTHDKPRSVYHLITAAYYINDTVYVTD